MIQSATQNDLNFLQHCARAAYEKYVSRMGREPAPMVADFERLVAANHVSIIRYENKPAGFIVLKPATDHLHVENVAVDPQFQGLGLGLKLLNFAEITARKLQLPATELYTNEKMTENLELYPHLGYVETERREEDGFSRVFFRKTL